MPEDPAAHSQALEDCAPGVTPGAQSSTAWEWAAGSSGTATFPASYLPAAGTYALWYLYDNGYSVLAGPVDITIQ